jgi:glycosyltransferase involved in cell wall biosynthesis
MEAATRKLRLAVLVAVVIPVFNEERSLPLVLDALPMDLVSRVVVADNGSTDGSVAAATRAADGSPRPRVEVVCEARRGYGSACLAGLARLASAPPDVVVFLDGDFSDHPEELPSLLAPIARGEADFVLGSRLLGRREPGALLPQARAGNALATRLIALATGFRYTDLGPFRAIRWPSLQALGMKDRDFGWTCEMQVKALAARLRVLEVPVSYRRRVGVSKIAGTLAGTLRAGAKILFRIARHGPAARRGSL